MSYEIRKAAFADWQSILTIYEQARAYMRQSGNPNQWGATHPAESLLRQDIEAGKLFLCVENGNILGVFYYQQGIDPTYLRIDGAWLNDEPYGVIHRIAVAGRGRGVASFCFGWALSQCDQLRIDTHRDNIPMQKALEKNGFHRCGIIYLENGDERIAYHKDTKKNG